MIKSRKSLIFLIIYAALIIGAAILAWNQRNVHTAQAPENYSEPAENGQTETKGWKEYSDADYKYSFSYPEDIFGFYDKQLQVPFLNAKKEVDAVAIVHTIPVEHCDLSGLPEHCTPTTTDISISFAPLDYSLATIKNAKGGTDLQPIEINGIEGWSMDVGAEGEGRIYRYLPLNDKQTLWISESYINENVVGNYKNAKGFITYGEQGLLAEKIYNTIKFSGQSKTYTHSKPGYSYTLQYPASWKVGPSANGTDTTLFSEDGNKTLVSVGVYKDLAAEVGASNAKYLNGNDLDLLMKDPEFDSVKETKFQNYSAYTTTTHNDTLDLKETQIWFKKGSLIYQLSYVNSDDKTTEQEQQIINSIKITK